jgi:hypothetical protein
MTNANKVTLPREVAEAIAGLRRLGNSTERIVKAANGELQGKNSRVLFHFAIEAEENYDLILSALVNGFIAEKSPEELEAERHGKVRCLYESSGMKRELRRLASDLVPMTYYDGVINGIDRTLDLLGIKIEGVDVDEKP